MKRTTFGKGSDVKVRSEKLLNLDIDMDVFLCTVSDNDGNERKAIQGSLLPQICLTGRHE